MQVSASLTSYPAVQAQTLSFNVIVGACIVTGVTIASNSWNPSLTHPSNIGEPTGLLLGIATFT